MNTHLGHLITMLIRRLFSDQRGATSLEYSVLAGFVALAMMTAMVLVGSALDGWYVELGNAWQAFLDLL